MRLHIDCEDGPLLLLLAQALVDSLELGGLSLDELLGDLLLGFELK
jgi:hypothetical protein